MKIALLQIDIQWHDVEANAWRAQRLIDALPACDLYVLPEMWATGFDIQPGYDLIECTDKAMAWMQKTARERDCAVAGTLAVREWPHDEGAECASLWRNRFFFVTPTGCVHYDKRHLFTYGGEQLTYTPGNETVIAEWRGVRFMLQTCFDLRFPETSRNTLAAPYDVLLYAANWPAVRRKAWDVLLQARAIENQAYCIGVNRTGIAPSGIYDGGSAAYDAYGSPIVVMSSDQIGSAIKIDIRQLHYFREKFSVLR